MDKPTRNLIQKATQDARRLVEKEYADQLGGTFDIQPDGTILAEPGAHLDDRERIVREKITEAIEHERARGVSAAESVDTYLREAAFTTLNRFVALKMLEARGLVQECISKGEQSSGFKEFAGLAPGLASLPDHGYRLYIESLFDEIGREVGILFDRRDPASLLWLRRQALSDLLAVLNSPELASVWGEDETIGWVYQYFNSDADREKARYDKLGKPKAPQNSYELAVRNQFFTPRYVVEFLTDNTLGRIWYEMCQGQTSLIEKCRYLVRRPNEIFLASGENALSSGENKTDLSQEELLKRPVYIEHRPRKDPRDIRVLDPACGSGHFLLYAFDLLETIYLEAWEDDASPESEVTSNRLRADFKEVTELRREIPRLILEHNLHGIDIDPRAVQIAALSLWMRAQRYWRETSLKPSERPLVVRTNVICAEPMPGEEDMRKEFTAGLKPRVLGQIVDEVFEKMKLAGEAGSLLKIEEEIKDAVVEAGKQWRQGPKPEQLLMFPGRVPKAPKQLEMRFDLGGVTDERFWEQAEDRILDALREYAERAQNGRAVRRRLFAEDAARGFAFIELCHKRYDVVLMNPPFGSLPKKQKLDACLPAPSAGNLYGAFFIRAAEMLCYRGCVGCITDRTFLLLPTYQEYRDLLRHMGLRALADLGWEVLDGAQVATAAYIVHLKSMPDAWFVDLRNSVDKEAAVREACTMGNGAVIIPNYLFETIPTHPLAHWAPPLLRNAFKLHRCFEPEFGIVRKGLSPGDSDRFVCMWWEIPQVEYGLGRIWAPYANGGPFSPFYRATKEVVEWRSNGRIIRAYTFPDGRPRYVCRSADLYGAAGLTFGKRGEVLNVQILPAGQVISNEGYLILPRGNQRDIWIFLAFFNSVIARYLVNMVCGLHKEVGAIKVSPIPSDLFSSDGTELASHSELIYNVCREIGNEETNPEFLSIPFGESSTLKGLFDIHQGRLKALRSQIGACEEAANHHIAVHFKIEKSELENIRREENALTKSVELGPAVEIVDLVDSIVSWLLGTAFGRWDVRIAIDGSLTPNLPDPFDPLPICPPGMLVGAEGLPAELNRIVSKEWLRVRPNANTLPPEGSVKNPAIPDSEYPIRISWDGILVDDPGFDNTQPHRDDIVRRVCEVLDLLWKDKAHEIEQEACEILGVSELRDYFRKPTGFFSDHIKRYSKSRRKAPIYWQLATPTGSYAVWLYYHRFTKDTFYKVLNDYVNPKHQEEERRLTNLRQEAGPNPTAGQRRDIAAQEAFVEELRTFRDEVARIAPLWSPNLNDGVVINFAPLWRLVPQYRPWQKECEGCWDKLLKGDYDWAQLAMHLWPERVVPKCTTDCSLAIAHGLEEALWVEGEDGKWRPKDVSPEELQALITERTSSTVKAALKDLLTAPAPSSRSGGRKPTSKRRPART